MEFPHDLTELFGNREPVGRLAAHQLTDRCVNQTPYVVELIDQLGNLSAQAQGAKGPATSFEGVKDSNNVLYILWGKGNLEGISSILGFLKVGSKELYLHDPSNQPTTITSLCLLDFYVHESIQRKGHGKMLLDRVLESEAIEAHMLALDGPSESLRLFMEKHYKLVNGIQHANNFVVYPEFFNRTGSHIKNGDHAAVTNGTNGTTEKLPTITQRHSRRRGSSGPRVVSKSAHSTPQHRPPPAPKANRNASPGLPHIHASPMRRQPRLQPTMGDGRAPMFIKQTETSPGFALGGEDDDVFQIRGRSRKAGLTNGHSTQPTRLRKASYPSSPKEFVGTNYQNGTHDSGWDRSQVNGHRKVEHQNGYHHSVPASPRRAVNGNSHEHVNGGIRRQKSLVRSQHNGFYQTEIQAEIPKPAGSKPILKSGQHNRDSKYNVLTHEYFHDAKQENVHKQQSADSNVEQNGYNGTHYNGEQNHFQSQQQHQQQQQQQQQQEQQQQQQQFFNGNGVHDPYDMYRNPPQQQPEQHYFEDNFYVPPTQNQETQHQLFQQKQQQLQQKQQQLQYLRQQQQQQQQHPEYHQQQLESQFLKRNATQNGNRWPAPDLTIGGRKGSRFAASTHHLNGFTPDAVNGDDSPPVFDRFEPVRRFDSSTRFEGAPRIEADEFIGRDRGSRRPAGNRGKSVDAGKRAPYMMDPPDHSVTARIRQQNNLNHCPLW